jgi:aspartyl-tRNA synthetase
MTWHEAMERYGTDKPDLRFGMELIDVSEVFEATEFKAFQAEVVKAIRVRGEAGMSRSKRDALIERAKQLGAAGLVWMLVGDGGALDAPILKFLSDQEQLGLVDVTGAEAGDLLLLAAGARRLVNRVLGQIRIDLGRPPVHEGPLRFLWVVDFPLFEAIGDDGRPVPAHHPFTMPHPDDLDLLAGASAPGANTEALLDVRSLAYDLVLNGWELGSGSVRIHRSDIQQEIFTLLGIDDETARQRFGFLLDAFRYGAPPHAGFAFGIDRLTAIFAGEENIREVIAFPKTQSGADPLTGAPTPIDPAQLRELGLSVLPKPKK